MIAKVPEAARAAAPSPVQEYDDQHRLIAVDPEQRSQMASYALQSIGFNALTNCFESYVNTRVQRRLGDVAHVPTGTYKQNLGADFAGDILGAGAIMAAEFLAPVQLHTITRGMRHLIDPLYTTVSKHAFLHDDRDPVKQREEIVRNERAIVRGALVMAGSVAGNLVTQKFIIKNPSPTKMVFLGKIAGASLTAALGVVTRMLMPHQAENLDRWMSKNIFTPLSNDKEEAAPSR